MAQTGYTPISLYYSTTGGATPTAGNLANGELALNITDGKLFYKDSGGTVQTIATKATSSTSGTSILYGNGSGGFSNVTIGSGISFAGGTLSATGSGGTVTAVSVASANGFTGTSSGGATPALTLATSVTGLLKGNGTAMSAATAGTDYVTPTGSETLTNKTIEAGTFTNGYTEEVATANTSTAYTIDLANGSVQILTLTGNCTFTFPTATAGKSFILLLKQDATGSRTVTWPAAVKWPGGTAPTITSTASKADKYVFTADNNSNWVGSNAGQNYTL